MRLPADGREYAHFTLTGLPDPAPTVEVQMVPGGAWTALTVTGDTGTILVAGPAAEAHASAVVLPTIGRYRPRVRLADNPEIVIRDAGPIDVY